MHSGWRGTFQKISQIAVKKMETDYNCKPENIIACICPSIRVCHFEVDTDVMELCKEIFSYTNRLDKIIKIGKIKDGKQKYNIDNVLITKMLLEEEKLKSEKNFDQRKLLISGLTFLRQQYKQRHVKNEFYASIIRLGDLEICQIPAELFSCFGLQIKAASKARYCIIWGYTNGMVGYMVKAEEYETCYEGRSTTFRQGEPERVTENLVELMKKHCE